MSWKTGFLNYKELSKSGIVTLVLISVLGGYLIGQPQEAALDIKRMLLTLLGVLFLASGSSALNQLQEHRTDAKMARTANRPLPAGRIQPFQAAVFVYAMLALGSLILSWVSTQVFALGFLAVLSYNGLYTLWWKRHWAYAAVPGAVPGALPILMGYAAATNRIWTAAGIYLFLILFYWQMPHFWVLALRYREDYRQGDFPTLPVAKGERVTVFQIALWCLGYVGLALAAPIFLRAGWIYLSIAIPVCFMLVWELRGFVKSSLSNGDSGAKSWLRFFLWVNFSLILLLAAAVVDVWSHHLFAPLWTR